MDDGSLKAMTSIWNGVEPQNKEAKFDSWGFSLENLRSWNNWNENDVA